MTRTITSVGSTIKGSRRSPAEIERGSWKIAARTAPTYTYARAVSRLCAQGGAAKSSPAGPTTARPLALLLAAQLLEAEAETLQCHADGWPRWRDSFRRNLAAQAPSSDTCSAFVRSISVATPTSLLRAARRALSVHEPSALPAPTGRCADPAPCGSAMALAKLPVAVRNQVLVVGPASVVTGDPGPCLTAELPESAGTAVAGRRCCWR